MTRCASQVTYSLAQQLERVAVQNTPVPVLAMNASSWRAVRTAHVGHLLVVQWEAVEGNDEAEDSVLMMRHDQPKFLQPLQARKPAKGS